ncbi:pyridoxamine 5'-phosphate oxidase family protein [Alkalicoccus chagannorensis]|uniref:pyridoxamine 5'-phosphate oxidase family protein n=1 Tax=Alkalicoccus chagannorensis TaxID=427072 RepID=UPI0003F95D79|nr:pyridoxamine 5'-phosphate oxidase family protein [Alkalicoccus chagannorensis]
MKIVSEGSRTEKETKILMEDILSRKVTAHLATVEDGLPKDSPVWFLWDGEAVWVIGHSVENTFTHRIRREPSCALGVVDFNPEDGTFLHVGIRGKGELLPHREDLVHQLFDKYMGEEPWDDRFTRIQGDASWMMIRITPGTVVVRDQSYQMMEGENG